MDADFVIQELDRLTNLNWSRCENVRSAVEQKLAAGRTVDQVVHDMVKELSPPRRLCRSWRSIVLRRYADQIGGV
jgi:hypothetical protein